MTFETLVGLIHAKPFVPFTLHLADGRAMRVAHPEFMGFVGDKRTLIVSFPGRGDSELLDLILIHLAAVGRRRARYTSAGKLVEPYALGRLGSPCHSNRERAV